MEILGSLPKEYGSGSGPGYGSGGYAYGYGSGYGDGDGYAYGYGDGAGYGYGDGNGTGSRNYWILALSAISSKWTILQQQRLKVLREDPFVRIAYWRSDSQGRPCNGGHGEDVHVGQIDTVEGPLAICTKRALHATLIPPKWQGERIWVVALFGEIQQEGDKLAALKREIIGECLGVPPRLLSKEVTE